MSQESQPQPVPLPKMPAPLPPSPRWVRLVEAVPTFVYALILAAVMAALACLDASDKSPVILLAVLAAFAPGAIRRHQGRQALVMLCAAVLALLALEVLHPASGRYPLVNLARFFVAFGMLAVCEMLLSGKPSKRGVATALLAALAAAGIFLTIQRFTSVYFCEVFLGFPGIPRVGLDRISLPALLILVPWLLIPIANRSTAGKARPVLLASLAAASVSAYLFVTLSLIYSLAQDSLAGHGPMPPRSAVMLLGERGRDEDAELIWQTVQNRWDTLPNKSDLPFMDWRSAAVGVLSARDPKGAAERFSKLLLERPNPQLAELLALLMAKEKRLETAPLLMRYSLLGVRTLAGFNCARALAEMGVPQSAAAILAMASVHERPKDTQGDFKLGESTIQQLKKILPEGKGETVNDWAKYYVEHITTLQSPLPPDVQADVQAEIECLTNLNKAIDTWEKGLNDLILARVNLEGKSEIIQRMSAGQKLTPQEIATLEKIKAQAENDLAVAGPDVNVPTTAGFRKEIDGYRDRVMKLWDNVIFPAIRVAGTTTTRPSSAPTNSTASAPAGQQP